MAKKTNELSWDIEVKEIKDGSKFFVKEDRVKEVRTVILKDDESFVTLTLSMEIDEHPLVHLKKLIDIGLKATLGLTVGGNPQKTLDDI